MEPKILEPRRVACVAPTRLDGIDVQTRAGIAENKFLWSSILLQCLQFRKDNVVHWDRSSPPSLTLRDENCPSKEVHVLPLKPRTFSVKSLGAALRQKARSSKN